MNYRRMVPNSISGLSMVLGVLSIYLSMDGEFSRAAIFIILAVLADSCDGRAARLLGVSGEFGKEMDSICDVCSFGMAPAVLISYGSGSLGTNHFVPLHFWRGTAPGSFQCQHERCFWVF